MRKKLLIIVLNTDPTDASVLGAPFFQASVAAAMDFDVEMVLMARAAKLAQVGVADGIGLNDGKTLTIYDFIKGAHEAGVSFKVCTPTIDAWGGELIPEVGGVVGAGYIIGQAMNDNTVTLTY